MRCIRVTMPDGSRWDVPVSIVQDSYIDHYGDEHEPDDDEILEWAEWEMNWADVEEHALRVKHGCDPDYQDGWVNGEKCIVDRKEPA